MKKVLHFIRVFIGVLCVIYAVTCVVLIFTMQEARWAFVFLAVVFGLFAFLLLRRKKEKPPVLEPVNATQGPISVSISHMDVPEDILRDMRKSYTKEQARRDAEILRESFYLAQQTTDFDVFFMRAELAQRTAYTLLQAEQAKCKSVRGMHCGEAAQGVINASRSLKLDFLDRAVKKETQAAMALKTPKGQRNRLEKLLNTLQEHETDFMVIEDEYNSALEYVRGMMP